MICHEEVIGLVLSHLLPEWDVTCRQWLTDSSSVSWLQGNLQGKIKTSICVQFQMAGRGHVKVPPPPPTHPPWCYLYQSSRPGFTPTVLCWPLNPTWPLTSGITIDQLTVGWSIDSIYQAFGAKKHVGSLQFVLIRNDKVITESISGFSFISVLIYSKSQWVHLSFKHMTAGKQLLRISLTMSKTCGGTLTRHFVIILFHRFNKCLNVEL